MLYGLELWVGMPNRVVMDEGNVGKYCTGPTHDTTQHYAAMQSPVQSRPGAAHCNIISPPKYPPRKVHVQ